MGGQKVNCAGGTREAGLGHALLSASSSHRWINCPPSAKLCENCEDQGSEYAQQGTDAHSLCQYKVDQHLEWILLIRQKASASLMKKWKNLCGGLCPVCDGAESKGTAKLL